MASINLNDLLVGEGEFLNLQDSLRRALHQSLSCNKEQEQTIKELRREMKKLEEDFHKKTIYDHDLESKIKSIMSHEMRKATSDYYFNVTSSTSSSSKRNSSLLFPSTFINDIEQMKVSLSKMSSAIEKKPSLDYINSVLAGKLNKNEMKALVDNVHKSYEKVSLQKYEQLSYDLMQLRELVEEPQVHIQNPPASLHTNSKYQKFKQEMSEEDDGNYEILTQKKKKNQNFSTNLDQIISNKLPSSDLTQDFHDPYIRKSELLAALKTKVNEEDLLKRLSKKVDTEKFHEAISVQNSLIKNHEAYITKDSLNFLGGSKDYASTLSNIHISAPTTNSKKKFTSNFSSEGDDYSNSLYEYFKEGRIDTLAQSISEHMKSFHSELNNLKDSYSFLKNKLKEAADAGKVEVLAAVTEEQRLRIDGILQGSIRIFPLYKELKQIREDVEKVNEKTKGDNNESFLNFSLRVNKNLRELYEMETKNSKDLALLKTEYDQNLNTLTRLENSVHNIKDNISKFDSKLQFLSFNDTNFKSMTELSSNIKNMESYLSNSVKKIESTFNEQMKSNISKSEQINQSFKEQLAKLNHFKDYINEKILSLEKNSEINFNTISNSMKVNSKKNDLNEEKIKQLKEIFLTSNPNSLSNTPMFSPNSNIIPEFSNFTVPLTSSTPSVSLNHQITPKDEPKYPIQNNSNSYDSSKKQHNPVTTTTNSLESSSEHLYKAFHSVDSVKNDSSSDKKSISHVNSDLNSQQSSTFQFPPPNNPISSPSLHIKTEGLDPAIQQFYQRHPEYSTQPMSPSYNSFTLPNKTNINFPIIDFESGLSSMYMHPKDVKIPILTSLTSNTNSEASTYIPTYSSTHQFMSLSDVDKRLQQLEKEKSSLRNIMLSKI